MIEYMHYTDISTEVKENEAMGMETFSAKNFVS